MTMYCCISHCKNSTRMESGTLLMSIPSCKQAKSANYNLIQRRRKLWIERIKINRPDITDDNAHRFKVCSNHFLSGCSSNLHTVDHPDWAPSLQLDVEPSLIDTKSDLDTLDIILPTFNSTHVLSDGFNSSDNIKNEEEIDIDDEDLPENSTKKGEIFEISNGQLVFVCCICNAVQKGLMEVENHLRSHAVNLKIDDQIAGEGEEINHIFEDGKDVWIQIDEEKSDQFYEEVTEPINNIDSNQPSISLDDKLTLDIGEVGSQKSTAISTKKKRIRKYCPKQFSIPVFHTYKCDICNKDFSKRCAMRLHMNGVHKKYKSHECNICGHKFSDKQNFKVHINRHNNYKPFKCDVCDKGFVTSTELRSHIVTHTGEKNYICPICGRRYSTNMQCLLHLRSCGKGKQFACEFKGCSLMFATTKYMRRHLRTHSTDRPYTCDICSRSFSTGTGLRNHKPLHKPDKQFQCRFCPSKFHQSSGRRGHEVRVHKVV